MERDVLRNLVIDDREQGRFLVSRQALTDPAILEIERREIFDKVWLYAGHETEIAEKNSYVARKVGGRPIILSRDKSGLVHAFYNSCPHRGNVVCREGSGTTKSFMCFYHAWTFGTDGTLIGLPGKEAYGPAFDRASMALRPVPRFESYRGLMFISYNPDVADLQSYLGEARGYIDAALDFSGGDVEVVQGQQSYSMKANWKLLVENSIDGYHAASTHHRYFRNYLPDIGLKPMDLSAKSDMPSNIVSRGLAMAGGHSGFETNALATPLNFWAAQELGIIRADLERNVGAERAHWVADYNRNLFIFPNLIFISLWQTIRTFYPITQNYMEIDAWALFPVARILRSGISASIISCRSWGLRVLRRPMTSRRWKAARRALRRVIIIRIFRGGCCLERRR